MKDAQMSDTPPAGYFRWRTVIQLLLAISLPLAGFLALAAVGLRHERIAQQLASLNCTVEFSHRTWVEVGRHPSMPGTMIERRSTLPPVVEYFGLGRLVRRIESVTFRSNDPKVLGQAFQVAASIKEIDTLSFYDTGVSEAALANLLTQLRIKKLYLRGEKLGRGRLEWLNHQGLTWLSISRTQFSSPAIDSLPLSLKSLDATRTRIDDAGLEKFVRLTNLGSLNLQRTPTSPAAIAALRAKMPWCKIQWESLPPKLPSPGGR